MLLFNQYAGNKVDRAVLYTACCLIKAICPDAHIVVSTSSTELYDGYIYYKDNGITFVPADCIGDGLTVYVNIHLQCSVRSICANIIMDFHDSL